MGKYIFSSSRLLYHSRTDIDLDNLCFHFQTKEDNLKKMMKEYGEIDSDLKIVQQLCK